MCKSLRITASFLAVLWLTVDLIWTLLSYFKERGTPNLHLKEYLKLFRILAK